MFVCLFFNFLFLCSNYQKDFQIPEITKGLCNNLWRKQVKESRGYGFLPFKLRVKANGKMSGNSVTGDRAQVCLSSYRQEKVYELSWAGKGPQDIKTENLNRASNKFIQ